MGLIDELNRLLRGPSLFDEQRFAQVKLTEETRGFIAQNPSGDNLIGLNRLLMEAAYLHETAKSRQRHISLKVKNACNLNRSTEIYANEPY
jgi:hypothetical protein